MLRDLGYLNLPILLPLYSKFKLFLGTRTSNKYQENTFSIIIFSMQKCLKRAEAVVNDEKSSDFIGNNIYRNNAA